MWLSDIKFVMLEMFPETQVSIIFYFGHRPLEILFQIFCVDSMFVYTQKRNIERMQMKTQKINYQVICFCQWFLAGKKVFIFYMMLWWGICFYPLLLFLWTFCKMQLNFEDQMSQKSIDRSNLIEDEKQILKKRIVQQGAVSSPSEHHPQTPAYASTQYSKKFSSGIYFLDGFCT